ncbi:aminoglycoside phosphotransferase family protein [Streptomyces marincola]|uniref:aminoglycoside phosphotransferase family protein n=1 Tax=Streptomyces marincola TaxID=2878388 RepID=UPI001CF587CD|nr:aminoglycoside phosphotransferase family protein [Streptomyces marincola]UCM89642.1 aminoglycoside phosphotransferase family protein [Streptomyces marincola]
MASAGARTAGFTASAARRAMEAACAAVRLDGSGAELIRLGENALFRLAGHPVIARVARSLAYMDSVRTEVGVSRWLASEGFPAARAVEDLEQPVVAAGHPVTFWHLIREGNRKATYGGLGGVLRDLHTMTPPDVLGLSAHDAFGRTALRVERAAGIPEPDRAFLKERGRELRERLADLRFESEKGPVHGDAHVQNLMVDSAGRVLLIDFENFCFDHPEWDLMVTATEHHRLGWQTREQYADFVTAYGRDLGDWEGFAVLRGIQEFRMTTWLMQNVGENRSVAEEYARRITSLRNGTAPRDWQPG